jgi:hypothetical protein
MPSTTPHILGIDKALARATYPPHHPKNTAFFIRKMTASHPQPTFVPRVIAAPVRSLTWKASSGDGAETGTFRRR